MVSSQGNRQFKVYTRKPPHAYVETFTISGVTATDGVDVTNVSLGPGFPFGIFTAHNDTPSRSPRRRTTAAPNRQTRARSVASSTPGGG